MFANVLTNFTNPVSNMDRFLYEKFGFVKPLCTKNRAKNSKLF